MASDIYLFSDILPTYVIPVSTTHVRYILHRRHQHNKWSLASFRKYSSSANNVSRASAGAAPHSKLVTIKNSVSIIQISLLYARAVTFSSSSSGVIRTMTCAASMMPLLHPKQYNRKREGYIPLVVPYSLTPAVQVNAFREFRQHARL